MDKNDINDFLGGEPKEDQPEEITALTKEQELLILKTWNDRPDNPPSLKELVQLCFGGEYDGRDKRAKLVKAFLASRKLRAPVSYQYTPKGILKLNDTQKEFIANNISSMNAREIAELLFNKKLTNLSQETRTVLSYVRTLDNRVKFSAPEEIPSEAYDAPKTEPAMIKRINKYIDQPIDPSQYNTNDRQKKAVKALIGYINSYRFVQQINTYEVMQDRDLFESSFVSYVYGKDDLTAEERDQYIILCSEVVISKNILARIEKFQRMADEAVDGTSDDSRRLSMTMVEAISGLRKEYNDCVKRQQSLMDDLKGKRSKRIQEKVKENESLVSLVEFWRNEEGRRRLVEAGNVRREALKNEIEKIDTMESLKIEIFGLDKDEIINA